MLAPILRQFKGFILAAIVVVVAVIVVPTAMALRCACVLYAFI